MPHINRVRVNNVRYNFGTQFYDDFIMRFDCKNVLYDLANGGGKSVLLLLLLQNLIPNWMTSSRWKNYFAVKAAVRSSIH